MQYLTINNGDIYHINRCSRWIFVEQQVAPSVALNSGWFAIQKLLTFEFLGTPKKTSIWPLLQKSQKIRWTWATLLPLASLFQSCHLKKTKSRILCFQHLVSKGPFLGHAAKVFGFFQSTPDALDDHDSRATNAWIQYLRFFQKKSVAKKKKDWFAIYPPETNIAPENRVSQKEIHLPTIHFQVLR